MIVRTDAVVLRNIDYGETSQIVTLFTRERGKLSVMAKGARRMRSRFGSTLQPMSYIQAVMYYKASRGLQTLSETSHVEAFHRIGRDLEKISVGLRVVELVNALMQEEEQNALLFNLLLQVLHRLDAADEHAANLLPYFQLKLASALGFAPDIDRSAVAALDDRGGLLALDSGSVLSRSGGSTTTRRASRTVLRAFAICARADVDAIMRMQMAPDVRIALNALVQDYLRHHVEDAYPTRGSSVLGRLLNPPCETGEEEA